MPLLPHICNAIRMTNIFVRNICDNIENNFRFFCRENQSRNYKFGRRSLSRTEMTSSFGILFHYFYNCRHMFRPIGTQKLTLLLSCIEFNKIGLYYSIRIKKINIHSYIVECYITISIITLTIYYHHINIYY